jgi:hypothetical protein
MHERTLLCAGEDPTEFMAALAMHGLTPDAEHSYRCYRLWNFSDLTAVWTDIGSGCLEPLMWEILEAGTPIRSIILVGTAGLIGDDPALCGKVYAVKDAYACAAGVSPDRLPVTACWSPLPHNLPSCTSLSTDQYYGFQKSTQPLVRKLHNADSRLRRAVQKYWQSGRLIEMEVAQFYFLCQELGSPQLRYLALKGVSNLDNRHATQTLLSRQILDTTVKLALELLRMDE